MIKGSHHIRQSKIAISYSKAFVPFSKLHSKRIAKALTGKKKKAAHRKAISLAMRRYVRTGKIKKRKPIRRPLSVSFRFLARKRAILSFLRKYKRFPYRHSSYNYEKLLNWSKKEIKLHRDLYYFTKPSDGGYDPKFIRQLNELIASIKIGLRAY